MNESTSEKLTVIKLHETVKNLSVKENFVLSEIKENRKQLNSKVKKCQELRGLASLRSGYFLKMNSSNVSSISQLPFLNQNKMQVYERIGGMAWVGTFRSQVNSLIKSIYNEKENLPEFFANLDFKNDRIKTLQCSYLSEGITIKEYFSCFTFPSLFGFYYTQEYHLSFLNFIIQIAEKAPNTFYEKNFTDHWLIDCIKYYAYSQNIGQFIRNSLGDFLVQFLRDPELLQYGSKRNISGIISKIDQSAPEMITNMLENVSLIPPTVRILLKKIANLGKDSNSRYNILFGLFLNIILLPALSNLKAYNLLPSSFHLDTSQTATGSILQSFITLFINICRPDILKKKYPGVAPTSQSSFKMKLFLISIIDNVSGFEVTGPKIIELLPVLEMHSLIMFFSEPDIFVLADIFEEPTAPQSIHKAAKDIPKPSENGISIPLDFFRQELWDFKAFDIVKPHIPDDSTKKPTDPIEIAGDALFKFLSFARIDSSAPDKLSLFIEYYEKQMIIQHNYVTEAYIRHFDAVSQQVSNGTSESVFISALQREIERHTVLTEKYQTELKEINRQIRIMDQSIDELVKRENESLPFVGSVLLSLFIKSNSQLAIDLVVKKEDMLLQPNSFFDFMQEYLIELKNKIGPIADYAVNEVARQFHSFVMSKLSYNEFKSFKRTYQRFDKNFVRDSKNILTKSLEQAPDDLLNLFKKKELFTDIIKIIKKAISIGIPLEAVRQIAKAFNLIRLVKEVEDESRMNHQELGFVFVFILFSANMPNMYSMGKYIQNFLVNIPFAEISFLSEEENDALKMFGHQITQLDQILSDF